MQERIRDQGRRIGALRAYRIRNKLDQQIEVGAAAITLSILKILADRAVDKSLTSSDVFDAYDEFMRAAGIAENVDAMGNLYYTNEEDRT